MEVYNKENREELFLNIAFIALSCISIVFGVLFFSNTAIAWIRNHFIICTVLYATLIVGIYLAGVLCLFGGRQAIAKLLLSVLFILSFAAVIAYVLQKTGFFKVFGDEKQLQEYLQKAGAWMPILYVLLQFLQVVILPIPSLVSTIAGIALFGPFQTMIYSFVGMMMGSLLGFYIGRRWGQRTVAWVIGRDALWKWKKKLRGKDNLLLSIMFLLPLFPDDVLCFLAGLSSMTFAYFAAIISSSRLLAIASTCYSVNFIPFTTWWGILLWVIIISVLIFACIYVYKNMDILQQKLKKFRRRKR